ncbi:MAG: hypothetical protein JNK53_02260 [Phycisphaerae bacterium]|nr:hypothetical protein [Phycisphaerae bacterium]
MKVVVNPNLGAKGLDWENSSIELKAGATLEIYNGYSADVKDCWIGAKSECASEPNAVRRDEDPHKAVWYNRFVATACQKSPPSAPTYIEPWRIRFYPMPQFLASTYDWDFKNSSIVGSLFLPTNKIRLYGTTVVWGQIAARDIRFEDSAGFRYDHKLDEVAGLTTGALPERGMEATASTAMRVVRYGFDAEASR